MNGSRKGLLTFERVRADIDTLPVIDCHEHTMGPKNAPKYADPLQALIQGYVQSDLQSASSDADMRKVNDLSVSLEERWKVFEPIWRRTEHTGYARVTKRVLRDVYGEKEFTLDALGRVRDKLIDLQDEKVYTGILDRANIRGRICDIWPGPKEVFSGRFQKYPLDRLVICLPGFHGPNTIRSAGSLSAVAGYVDRSVVTLDEYVDACREAFIRFKAAGAICMKDQLAYNRSLHYENAPRNEAERLFNFVMEDPRRALGWPEAIPLDDWLFHQFMRMARDLAMPVQIHTGHMPFLHDDIAKGNAALLTSTVELHRDVRFSLLHASWPYTREWLFFGRNYPNAWLDCCWAHIIDPARMVDTLAEAVTAVPHGKVLGFGGDYFDTPEFAAAHLEIARDNISAALARLVDAGWIDEDAARGIAADWLFNNPNRLFGLGMEPVAT